VAPAIDLAECVERLLHGFDTYDAAVDVVSAFEMAFTTSNTPVPKTVAHFERFPRIPDGSGKILTPDFSVVFDDGRGLVGEIARIALRDESVESLCEQIGRYDALQQLPLAHGLADVSRVDVLVLVPASVGVGAVKRIINERFADEDHPYKPSVAPCVVQFAYTEGRYIFQRLLEPLNGLPDDGERPDGLGHWFSENGDFKAKPQRFSDIKADRAFINDPVDPLYLATHLWAKTFATMAGASSRPVRLDVTAAGLAAELRTKFGGVRANDVRHAMELLQTAQLASPTADGWVVAWEELRVPGEKELAHAIATRACRPPARTAAARLKEAEEAAGAKPARPDTLF
jgi:hypothetical protein